MKIDRDKVLPPKASKLSDKPKIMNVLKETWATDQLSDKELNPFRSEYFPKLTVPYLNKRCSSPKASNIMVTINTKKVSM